MKSISNKTVSNKIIRAHVIILGIFLWFDCQFLSSPACYKQYKQRIFHLQPISARAVQNTSWPRSDPSMVPIKSQQFKRYQEEDLAGWKTWFSTFCSREQIQNTESIEKTESITNSWTSSIIWINIFFFNYLPLNINFICHIQSAAKLFEHLQ